MQQMETTKKHLIFFLSITVLFAIGLSLIACTGTPFSQESPLEPGQLFRFRKEAVTGLTLRSGASNKRELNGEELAKALSCLESFRYQSVVYEEPVGGKNEYSFSLQSVSERAPPAYSAVVTFRENGIRIGGYWYLSEQDSLRELMELL